MLFELSVPYDETHVIHKLKANSGSKLFLLLFHDFTNVTLKENVTVQFRPK